MDTVLQNTVFNAIFGRQFAGFLAGLHDADLPTATMAINRAKQDVQSVVDVLAAYIKEHNAELFEAQIAPLLEAPVVEIASGGGRRRKSRNARRGKKATRRMRPAMRGGASCFETKLAELKRLNTSYTFAVAAYNRAVRARNIEESHRQQVIVYNIEQQMMREAREYCAQAGVLQLAANGIRSVMRPATIFGLSAAVAWAGSKTVKLPTRVIGGAGELAGETAGFLYGRLMGLVQGVANLGPRLVGADRFTFADDAGTTAGGAVRGMIDGAFESWGVGDFQVAIAVFLFVGMFMLLHFFTWAGENMATVMHSGIELSITPLFRLRTRTVAAAPTAPAIQDNPVVHLLENSRRRPATNALRRAPALPMINNAAAPGPIVAEADD